MKIDKDIIIKNFSKSKNTYDDNAVIQKFICSRLMDIVDAHCSCSLDKVFEIGCGTGLLTKMLVKEFEVNDLILNDIAPDLINSKLISYIKENVQTLSFIHGDAEQISFPEDYDLLLSASTIQWFNDLDSFFEKAAKQLNKDGLFIFSTFGKKNFYELKDITGNGLNYLDRKLIEEKLVSNFDILYFYEEKKKMLFKTPMDVLNHLKKTGVNGLKTNKIWTKSDLKRFSKDYVNKFSEKDSVHLTYAPIYFVCKKK
ncbi:malonyl-ACP O-methyltransferase BioC [Marinilabiliaceae bacterium JC040]|nr:malonyl-ACP O-methyltransferase BioC [Marinilabiliaceae bacterium JC040]